MNPGGMWQRLEILEGERVRIMWVRKQKTIEWFMLEGT